MGQSPAGKLLVRGWAFPDSPPPTPRGQDATRLRIEAIRFLSAARKLVGLNCRPAYFAICVAEAHLRNKVRAELAANPSSRELLQSELSSPAALSGAEPAGSESSTETRWTCGSGLWRA